MKTIDCTPSWQAAARIYLAAIMNRSNGSEKSSIEGIMQMAEVAQAYVDLLKKAKQAGINLKELLP